MLKPLKRDPLRLEVLHLFRRVTGSEGHLDDPGTIRSFVDSIETSLQAAASQDASLRGLRGQALFANLVVALDGCQAMLTLDAGDVYGEEGMQPGDFLLVLRNGRRLLVEVKTVSAKATRLKVRAKDAAGLKKTAELLGAEPFYACLFYNTLFWALVDVKDLEQVSTGTNLELKFRQAMLRNFLSILGDKWIGTRPPLELVLFPEPRTAPALTEDLELDATSQFTVGRVEIIADGSTLITKRDRSLAYFLMLFGGWSVRRELRGKDGVLSEVRFVCEPEMPTPGQGFQFVGPMSQMYSGKFLWETEGKPGSIPALDVKPEPGLIPKLLRGEVAGRDLALWVMTVSPNDRPGDHWGVPSA